MYSVETMIVWNNNGVSNRFIYPCASYDVAQEVFNKAVEGLKAKFGGDCIRDEQMYCRFVGNSRSYEVAVTRHDVIESADSVDYGQFDPIVI